VVRPLIVTVAHPLPHQWSQLAGVAAATEPELFPEAIVAITGSMIAATITSAKAVFRV
jgi:hypothetical protein